MRIGRTSRVLASAVFGAVLAVGAATSSASAADGRQRANLTSDSPGMESACIDWFLGGEACFEPYGEWFWVRDVQADNDPVAIIWNYQSPIGTQRSGVIYHDYGKAAGWANLNKSFEENGWMTFSVCNINLSNGDTWDCSPDQYSQT